MPEAYDGDWMDRERDEISQLRGTMKSERERERGRVKAVNYASGRYG